MAVEAVVSVVIQKVTELLIQESIIVDKVIDQVEDIRLQLRQMRGFLMDAEERQKIDDNVREWVREYLKTLYEVEDMVESYVLRLARKKREMGFFQNYGFFFHDLRACHILRKKMKQIEETIKKLNERKPGDVQDASLRRISIELEESQLGSDQIISDQSQYSFGDISSNSSSSPRMKRMPSSFYKEDDSDFVGFKDDEKELEKRLAGKGGEKIGVVGLLGSGKTTLVRRAYNHKQLKAQFACRAWVNVSEEHALKDLLLKVWNQVNKKRDTELAVLDEGQLKAKLFEFLEGQKYLIVLDDAREKPDAWKELTNAFQDIRNGSKVVLITREKNIAEFWDGKPLCPKLLGDNESWKLFKRQLSLEVDNPDYTYTTQKHQIQKKCKGLPLNIVLLGGLLSTKRMSSEEQTRLFSQANWHETETWLLSYNDLPAHYKLCLLYLALFPKEFDVSVRRILRLWLAEGFLPLSSPRLNEDLAEECFNNLVHRNLIKISKFRSDGGPKKCHLPGFLREHLSPIAQEISLFHIHDKSAEQSVLPARRIVEYADIKHYDSDVKNLRSYLSFNFSRYDTPAQEVGNFLRKIIGNKGFGLLRVLDLEGVYKPQLPPTLKHLFQLRYLGLRWTFLDTLPQSVGDLPFLETLDLKRTYISNLPSSVWKLKHIQHLNLPQVRLDMRVHQPSSQLLTLWGLVIDDCCNMENGLNLLVHLRELGITCRLKQFDKLRSWIANLIHLQSLSLTSTDEMGRPSDLSLEPLSGLSKLSHLKLLGKLSHQLNKEQFPLNLKVLTLSFSHLKEDPMSILSQLPCLGVLRFLAKSYLGQKMHCPRGGFSTLRVLKLWMLDDLEEWTVQQGGMPKIKEINIRCCHNLKELPLALLQRNTLEELTLTNMPEEFLQNVKENKCGHTNLIINKYDFSPLPWEKDADLWDLSKETTQV